MSRTFLEGMSDRVYRQVGQLRRKVGVLEHFADEPDEASEKSLADLSDAESKVIGALATGKWPLRSVKGLSTQSKVGGDEVMNALTNLIGQGLVKQTYNKKGQLRWYLTEQGSEAAYRQSQSAGSTPPQ
jgi:hypothetical protein